MDSLIAVLILALGITALAVLLTLYLMDMWQFVRRTLRLQRARKQRTSCYTPRVSILVRDVGTETVLRRCLEHLAVQEYRNYELIVISTAPKRAKRAVAAVTKAHPRLKVRTVLATTNRGKAQLAHRAVRLATGSLCIVISTEMRMAGDAVRNAVYYFVDPSIQTVVSDQRTSRADHSLRQSLDTLARHTAIWRRTSVPYDFWEAPTVTRRRNLVRSDVLTNQYVVAPDVVIEHTSTPQYSPLSFWVRITPLLILTATVVLVLQGSLFLVSVAVTVMTILALLAAIDLPNAAWSQRANYVLLAPFVWPYLALTPLRRCY